MKTALKMLKTDELLQVCMCLALLKFHKDQLQISIFNFSLMVFQGQGT